MKKKAMMWSFDPPPTPKRRGVAKYYWYVHGADRRADVVVIGRTVEDGRPFMLSLFMNLSDPEEMAELDGAWLGPIQVPYVNERARWVDELREKRRKK